MNELLAKFKGLKSLHFLGKGKTFKKGHLGIKRGLIRKGRDTILRSIEFPGTSISFLDRRQRK